MTEIASYTGGRGKISFEYAGYDICHNAEKQKKTFAYDTEYDIDNSPDSVFCFHGAAIGVK